MKKTEGTLDDFVCEVLGDGATTLPQLSTTKEVTPMAKEKTEAKPLRKDKIQCVKCNGQFAQRPDVREKRIAVFGSAAKLEANYLCRECRKGKEWNGKEWVAEEKKAKPVKEKAAKKK